MASCLQIGYCFCKIGCINALFFFIIIMYTQEQKQQFAKFLDECNNNAFAAGEKMFPDDNQEARKIAHFLFNDEEVAEYLNAIQSESSSSKDELFVERQLKGLMQGAYEDKDKLKAIELYMRLKGLDRKTDTVITNTFAPAVIEVEMPKDWESEFFENQQELKREA